MRMYTNRNDLPKSKFCGNKKLTKSKSGLRVVPVNNTERSPFELREPIWSPDSESGACSNVSCGVLFDLLHRRHHCRRCGRLFCDQCCQTRVQLTRMCFVDPVRQCRPCADLSGCEEMFFARSLKVLLRGAEFCVLCGEQSGALDGTAMTTSAHCEDQLSCVLLVCLTADHRLLVFHSASGVLVPDSIVLDRIDKLAVDLQSSNAHDVIERVYIHYRAANSVEQKCVTLLSRPDIGDCRRSTIFIRALQKAMELVSQSREPSAI